MIETIDNILERSENLCFHFTDKQNWTSIQENGLMPLNNGKNSRVTGREKPAVFFSKGFRGTLGTVNRFLINISRAPSSENRQYYEREFPLLFKMYNENSSNNDWVYSIAYEYFKDKIYLVLDLNGVTKDDFEKLPENIRKGIDYIIDDINFENSHRQTIRNMHTIVGKGVDTSKIKKLIGDAISVLINMYDSYALVHPDQHVLQTEEWENREITCDLITGFIQFLKERNKDKNPPEIE